MDIGELRNEYTLGELRFKDLSINPIAQFETWFKQAQKANIPEPNAMVLTTVSTGGMPSARTVLLKEFNQKGFVFFTHYDSNKAQEIKNNPQVALLFPWFILQRQVVIRGSIQKNSRTDSDVYFASRPRGSQLSTWSSTQSKPIASQKVLQTNIQLMQDKFANRTIPLPDNWGGYCVNPQTIEFWQGRPNRLHDRFVYNRESTNYTWRIQRLSP